MKLITIFIIVSLLMHAFQYKLFSSLAIRNEKQVNILAKQLIEFEKQNRILLKFLGYKIEYKSEGKYFTTKRIPITDSKHH